MSYCIQTLKEVLTTRQRLNASYSLRAFARDLQINPGSLSSILKGQRRIPSGVAEDLAFKLRLPPEKKHKFLRSIERSGSDLAAVAASTTEPLPEANLFELDEAHYRIIAEWEHYAVMNLIETEGFDPSPKWIGERLNVPTTRIEIVLLRLLETGLLRKEEATGKLTRTHASLRTTEDVRSTALRESHLEELELARKKLDATQLEERDYSSVTVACDPRKIPEAKRLIRHFRSELAGILSDGTQTEVYQLNVQLFPLTQLPRRDEQ